MTLHFFSIFVFSILLSSRIFETDRWGYIFAGVGGYATQHIAYSISGAVKNLFFSGVQFAKIWDYLFFRILPYLIVGAIVYVWLIRPAQWNGLKAKPKKIVISGVILLSCLVLGTCINIMEEGTEVVSRIYAAISCSLGLYVQFLYSAQEMLEMKNEEMEKLLHVSQAQNKMGTDAVAMINMKCHDLKHQLFNLEGRMDTDANRKYVREISDAVNIYDSQLKTGCDALNVVLMQKRLLCEGYRIPFDYLGNGEKLNFMSSADIASLIGNALDNAVEGELKEEESERFINMSVKTMGEILLIHVDNYCTNAPEFKEGLPETTKEDKQYNGFGVKSMQYITEKYGGQIKFDLEENVFNVDMIFPLSKEAAA